MFDVLPVATLWGFMGMKRGRFIASVVVNVQHCGLAIFILTCGLEVWELDDCHQHFFLLNFLYFDPGE